MADTKALSRDEIFVLSVFLNAILAIKVISYIEERKKRKTE